MMKACSILLMSRPLYWCGVPIRMMNIQEVGEKELCIGRFVDILSARIKIAS